MEEGLKRSRRMLNVRRSLTIENFAGLEIHSATIGFDADVFNALLSLQALSFITSLGWSSSDLLRCLSNPLRLSSRKWNPSFRASNRIPSSHSSLLLHSSPSQGRSKLGRRLRWIRSIFDHRWKQGSLRLYRYSRCYSHASWTFPWLSLCSTH